MLWRASLVFLLVGAAMAPVAQAEWPSFHNDARHTGFVSGSSYPVFSEVWWNNRTPDGAQVKASPVLKDNILITASLGSAASKGAGLVRALDAASGKELWRHQMAKPVESTPAISGERVFVVDTGGALKALNLKTGAVEHTASAGATLGHLTLSEGKLFLGTEAGDVKAYLASTLTLLWAFRVSELRPEIDSNDRCQGSISAQPVRGAVAVFQGKVFFGSMNHWIYAIDEQGTGNLKTFIHWSYKAGDVVLSTPAINTRFNQDPRVVFGSYDGKVYSFLAGQPDSVPDNACFGEAATPAWEFKVPTIVDAETQDEQVSKVHSSPAAAGDKVFFGANNGKVYGLWSDNGDLIWETTAGNVLQPVTGSPAVANGKVVIGSEDKNVYWINATDGKILKTFTTQAAIDTGTAIEGDRAFVVARDGTLYMFGPEIPRRADLQVTTIQMVGGQLQVTVRNAGDAASANSTVVRLLVDGTFLANVAVSKIEPGQSATVSPSGIIPGEGNVEVEAIVDPDNTITESNDSNNGKTQRVNVDPVTEDGGGDGDGGDDGGGFKIPAPGFVPLLALLGLAALALRRRTR